MTAAVIVDTGPLVALLNRRDGWHAWAKEQFSLLQAPLRTCEAVITETTHLLRRTPEGSDAVLELMARDLLRLEFDLEADLADVRQLMRRYRDVPMSLADACLVKMAERQAGSKVLSLDGDFRRYRRRGRQVIPLIMPAARA